MFLVNTTTLRYPYQASYLLEDHSYPLHRGDESVLRTLTLPQPYCTTSGFSESFAWFFFFLSFIFIFIFHFFNTGFHCIHALCSALRLAFAFCVILKFQLIQHARS